MFKSALGGGFIVSFLVILKVFTHHAHFPLFGEAFIYSLIYSVGFVLIHFLHFTLATKQPALTANTIAVSIDEGNIGDKTMMKTVVLISEISRAQFISLIGNILIVLPFTFIIGMIYTSISGNYIVTSEEANEMMMSLHPWKSGSLFYAGIAGVFLMLSGVIAGYYDNKVIYGRIPERLQQHPYLKRVFKPRRLLKITEYLQNNSGVIIGNIMLGFMLGFASMIGKIFGIPFDVRHVTLSAGVFGLGLQGNDTLLSLSFILEISFSLLLMGIINLIISFGLAIYVAVRSRSLETSLMKILLKSLKHYFFSNPIEFFYPSKKSEIISEK
jgi:site-specific recombinase